MSDPRASNGGTPQPHAPHGLRYIDVVAVPGGGSRWFYEATRADGAHELRTVLQPAQRQARSPATWA